MNLNKHMEFISPSEYNKPIHIIGVGAVGSRVAEMLARLGFSNMSIYDFDIVEDGNITNQIYTYPDLGLLKEDALERHLKEINPQIRLSKNGAYDSQYLSGVVFLCVDSIKTRRRIATRNANNLTIDAMFDMRMRLTDAQAYGADWSNPKHVSTFISSMQFEDKDDTTPLSVCGTTLSVAPTVLTLVSYTVMNFLRYIKNMPIKQSIFLDTLEYSLLALVYN